MPKSSDTPEAVSLEGPVLGLLMLDSSTLPEVREFIGPDDFYREPHRIIFKAMLELLDEGGMVDYPTVFMRLKEKNQIEGIGGPLYLESLFDEKANRGNLKSYVQIIHDKSTLRRLLNVFEHGIVACRNGKGKDIQELIDSVQKKIADISGGAKIKGSTSITKRIRSYVEVTDGNLEVTRLYKELNLVTEGNKKAALMAIGRLVKEGVLAKIKPGIYRVTENDAPVLKLSQVGKMGNEINMCYPFGLERYFVTYPKSIVLVSGEPDSGKTAWLLNIAKDNMHLAPIYYWTSEMGLPELYSRVENFEDFDAQVWDEKVVFRERSENFEDMVRQYPDAIHIIDNLELHDNFYLVGGIIDSIWRALNKGVAIIGLHKDRGKEYAQGGMAALKRPRLWLDLAPRKGGGNVMQVKKFKNWRDKVTNLKNRTYEYHLVKGCKLIEME